MTEPKSLTLQRVATGDSSAVEECIDKYGNLVWSLARRFSPTQVDAEDAAQEIFLEVWQKASRFDPDKASEVTFITMIARRRLIDRFRKRARSLESTSIQSSEFDHACTDETNLSEIIDEAAKATRCLDALRNQPREILKRSIHDGKSYSQIASELEMPLGTVKTFARRALIQLRECMSRFSTSGAAAELGGSHE